MWSRRSKKWITNVRIQKHNGEQLGCKWSTKETVGGLIILIIITRMGLESVVTTKLVRITGYNQRHDDSKYTTNEEQ